LDVAAICLGNMKHAAGARYVQYILIPSAARRGHFQIILTEKVTEVVIERPKKRF
jgi:hypothetical protein